MAISAFKFTERKMLREISVEKITETVSELCIRSNKKLPQDIEEKIS